MMIRLIDLGHDIVREAAHFSVKIQPNLNRLKVTLKRERLKNRRLRSRRKSEDFESFCFSVLKTVKSKAGTINSKALWTFPIQKLRKRKLNNSKKRLEKKIKKLPQANQQLRTTLLMTSGCM